MKDRKICMPSPNIADDGGGKHDSYLTDTIFITGTALNSEKDNQSINLV